MCVCTFFLYLYINFVYFVINLSVQFHGNWKYIYRQSGESAAATQILCHSKNLFSMSTHRHRLRHTHYRHTYIVTPLRWMSLFTIINFYSIFFYVPMNTILYLCTEYDDKTKTKLLSCIFVALSKKNCEQSN